MKRTILSFLLATAFLSVMAQAPGEQRRAFKPEDMAKRQAERIQKACETNQQQYDALYNFFLRQAQQRQDQRPEMKPGEQPQRPSEEEMVARRAEMEKRQQAQNDTIRTILTAEQYAKYEKMQKERREHRQGRPQGGPQGGFPGGPQGGFQQ